MTEKYSLANEYTTKHRNDFGYKVTHLDSMTGKYIAKTREDLGNYSLLS